MGKVKTAPAALMPSSPGPARTALVHARELNVPIRKAAVGRAATHGCDDTCPSPKALFGSLDGRPCVSGELETLETGTRPEVRVARRRPYPAGHDSSGGTQNDLEGRWEQPA